MLIGYPLPAAGSQKSRNSVQLSGADPRRADQARDGRHPSGFLPRTFSIKRNEKRERVSWQILLTCNICRNQVMDSMSLIAVRVDFQALAVGLVDLLE